MLITWRGTLIFMLAAPLLALGTWFPVLEWAGLVYIILCLGLFYYDWRLAGSVDGFEVQRRHDRKLSLGVYNPISLSLRNRRGRTVRFQLRDEPPDEFDIETRLHHGEVAAWKTWRVSYQVRPKKRGDYRFGNVHLRWQGPLGVARRQGSMDVVAAVKVYPNMREVHRYELLLQQNRLHEMGLRQTRSFGEGTEFERLREYYVDDDYRRINWKASARRFRPVSVQYQTERSQNILIAIDTGRMMQSPVAEIAKLDYVINAGLLLAYVATGKGDKVGLMTFSDEVSHYLSPRQGRGQFYRMLELLYGVEPQPVEPHYGRAISYLKAKQRKRALVVIFTDLSGSLGVQTLVQHCANLSRTSLIMVVTIRDPEIDSAASQPVRDSNTVFQRSAAMDLLSERELTLTQLRRQGMLALDSPADQISPAVINRYLELKGKTRL